MAKVLVAFPAKFELDADAAIAAANLERNGHELAYAHSDGRGVYGAAQARIRVAEKALEGGFDYLMMIDSDTIVPADTLKLLLDPPAPIVLGIYPYKNGTGNCPFFKFKKDNDGNDKWALDEIPLERFDVKAAGLGCALISTDVFRKIPRPWFNWDERPTGHTGEDIWFCNAARKAGYAIQADGRVRCKHVGRKVYG